MCEIQLSDVCVESIAAQRENLPLSSFSDCMVLQELYCEACFCLFSLTLVIFDYTLDHVPKSPVWNQELQKYETMYL